MALSDTTIQTVKATVPVLKEHGGSIILAFYDILFTRYPSVKAFFNMDRQKGGASSEDGLPSQVASLARAVVAYASYIDNLEVILPVVENICHKHVSRGVQPVQYDAVGECLLAAIKNVLGDAATEGIMTAWAEAYGFLAETFISIEKDLRAKLAEKAGFDGMVDMRIESIGSSDDGARTISFVPVNNKMPEYKEGQFVSIDIPLEEGNHTMTSMKLINESSAKLTIKVPESKEKATTSLYNAVVNDVFKVSMPCGKTKN